MLPGHLHHATSELDLLVSVSACRLSKFGLYSSVESVPSDWMGLDKLPQSQEWRFQTIVVILLSGQGT